MMVLISYHNKFYILLQHLFMCIYSLLIVDLYREVVFCEFKMMQETSTSWVSSLYIVLTPHDVEPMYLWSQGLIDSTSVNCPFTEVCNTHILELHEH